MGTCQCERKISSNEGELKNFFSRNQENTNNNIKKENNEKDNEINSDIKINMVNPKIHEEQNQKEEEIKVEDEIKREDLKEKENKINAKIISDVISKNLNRIYNKDKYHKLIAQTKKIFFENEELNFTFDQLYFKQLFDSKLSKFINNKEVIINDLFSEKFRKTLYSFPKLKEALNSQHNNYILSHHKDFLKDFMSYGIKKEIINKDMIELKVNKQISNKIPRNFDSINVNKNNTMKKRNMSLHKKQKLNNSTKVQNDDNVNKNFKTSKTKIFNTQKKLESLEEAKINSFEKEKDNNIEACLNLRPLPEMISIENIIKKELDQFYDAIFSSKKTFVDFEKKSIFWSRLTSEERDKVYNLELKNLINIFYYIYILKKYNYLSNTNKCFYKINPVSVRKKSILTNKLMFNKRVSISKKENMLKMKILKGLFKKKSNEESEVTESLSSIISQEDKKDCHSLISAGNELHILKLISDKENDQLDSINKNKSKFHFEEEKPQDLKSENNKSIHMNNIVKAELIDKEDKNSFQKKPTFNARKKKIDILSTNTFAEFYNGQYDNTVFLYAGLGTLVNQELKKLYHGTFRYGKKEGLGIMYQINEDNTMEYYMGEFHQNKILGFGTQLLIKDTELIHKEGIFDGDNLTKGKYRKINLNKESNTTITTRYEGNFENKKFSGNGTLVIKTYKYDNKLGIYVLIQEIDYKGEFFNDKKNGKGKEVLKHFKYSNKNYKYEGNFINDLKDGYGTITYDKSNFVQKYEGFFVKDKPFQSYGIINFKSGDIYEGFFENSLKDNIGLYLFIDSKSNNFIEEYFGGFLEDNKDGIGRTVVEDSNGAKMLRGMYKKGDKEGQFVKVIYKRDVGSKNKKRRFAKIEETLLNNDNDEEKKGDQLPRIQIKSFPVYEENEIIDINENYVSDLNH